MKLKIISKSFIYPSPTLSVISDISNPSCNIELSTCSNNIINYDYQIPSSSLASSSSSPLLLTSNIENSINEFSFNPYIQYSSSIPTNESLYYLPIQNELSCQYNSSLFPISYIQEQPQQQIIYY
eukprot:jgi/Orpsp1_1/1183295/evm.model.c7180000084589.1